MTRGRSRTKMGARRWEMVTGREIGVRRGEMVTRREIGVRREEGGRDRGMREGCRGR